ncbi:MAG: BrnT family toxin [Deltaproteobacteria bacterium]|nr:BrnT family toxin [Deltaproteobacteria bacterium]
MQSLSFEWDPEKEAKNRRKHGISFVEAQTVFYDADARLISDPDHSVSEDRFIMLGLSNRLRLLVVSHCYRRNSSVIRIISARRANKREQVTYKENVS